jgi:CRP-like cAMP-binding protein
VDTLTPRPFRAGEYVVKKGDEGDAFYVIQEGKIMVRDIEVGGQKYEDNELGPGDYFGERALVTKEPRAANCVAATNGIALVVDSDTFTKVMGNLSQLVLKSSDKRALVSFCESFPHELDRENLELSFFHLHRNPFKSCSAAA